MMTTHHVPLHKKANSDRWYFSATIGGQRIKRSTKTSDYSEAQQYADTYCRKLRAAQAETLGKNQWSEHIDGIASSPNEWLAKMLSSARGRARKKNVPFQLTIAELALIAKRSNGRCEITGIPFSGSRGDPFRQSLDRITPQDGYVFDNCRLVGVAVNKAMGIHGERVFMKIAKAVTMRYLQHEISNDLE